MAQHFLLSTKARTISLAQVLRLSDAEAYDAFTLRGRNRFKFELDGLATNFKNCICSVADPILRALKIEQVN